MRCWGENEVVFKQINNKKFHNFQKKRKKKHLRFCKCLVFSLSG
jgi:hypothetical protein